MSGVQTIIDSCQKIEFDRKRIVGQSISRSQRIRTGERVAAQPFALVVSPKPVFRADTDRTLIEEIFLVDRFAESTISLGNNPKFNFMVEYRGEIQDPAERSAITINTWTTNQVVLTTLPALGTNTTTSTIVFNAGDYIQPANSRYPYVITAPVMRGSGSTITATVHRSLITSENIFVQGQTLKIGTETTMKVILTEIPNYQFYQKDYFNFTGDFKLIEAII